MKRLFCILLFSVGYILSFAQSSNITGYVYSRNDSIPQQQSSIVLLSRDSLPLKNANTNTNGYFSITSLNGEDYLLRISSVGFESILITISNLNDNLFLDTLYLEPSQTELKEITVKANSVITTIDRQIITPNKKDIDRSINGIDLLQNIQLSGIEVSRRDNSINGIRGGNVQLRINGAPATVNDIIGLDAKTIFRIDYHDAPSLRYEGAEAVLDFYVKKRETGGSIGVATNNSVNVGWGNERLTAKFNNKKSEFSISGGHTYHLFNQIYQNNKETFNFVDGTQLTRTEIGEPPNKFKEYYYDVRATYTYSEPTTFLFLATLSYDYYNVPTDINNSNLYLQGKKELALNKWNKKIYEEKKPVLNLYFQKNLKKKQFIAFDIVGTSYIVKSDQEYKESIENSLYTHINNITDGEKYSIIAQGIYEKDFTKGKLSAGVKQSINFIDNTYTGLSSFRSHLNQYFNSIYAEWQGKIKKFGYSLGVGSSFYRSIQEGENYNDYKFTPTLRLSYNLGKLGSLRYQGKVSTTAPGLGDINDSKIIIDSFRIRQGNPALTPEVKYINNISYLFNKQNIMFNLDISNESISNPIIPNIFRQDDKFILQTINGELSNNLNVTSFLRLAFFKRNLNVHIRGGLRTMHNKANDYEYTINNWWTTSGVTAFIKKFTIWSEISTRRNAFIGETIYYREQFGSVGVDYKWNNYKIGLMGMTNFGKFSTGETNLNKYASTFLKIYTPEMKSMINLKFTMNLNYGKGKDTDEKRIENNDYDSGVLK